MRARSSLGRGVLLLLTGGLLLQASLWQWERGRTTGRLLHYTYAVEWALLVVVAAVLVLRPRREAARPAPYDRAGRLLGPPLAPGEELPPTVRDRLRPRRRGRVGHVTTFPPDVVAAVCRHMDDDHAEAALLIARALGDVPDAASARTTDVDGDGLVLTVTRQGGSEQVVRVPFAVPVTERAQVRTAVVELHDRAVGRTR